MELGGFLTREDKMADLSKTLGKHINDDHYNGLTTSQKNNAPKGTTVRKVIGLERHEFLEKNDVGRGMRQCPECGSKNLSCDYRKSELFCGDCGLIIDEQIFPQITPINRGNNTAAISFDQKINDVFDVCYDNLPSLLNELKEEHKETYIGLSKHGFTRTGKGKKTAEGEVGKYRKRIILGLLLDPVLDSEKEPTEQNYQPFHILNLPDLITVDEAKLWFESLPIVARNISRWSGLPLLKYEQLPDEHIYIAFDKERWIHSFRFTQEHLMERFYGKERVEKIKWLYIKACREAIRRSRELFVLLSEIERKRVKEKKTKRWCDYMFILSELYLLELLEKEMVEKKSDFCFRLEQKKKSCLRHGGFPAQAVFKRRKNLIRFLSNLNKNTLLVLQIWSLFILRVRKHALAVCILW